MWVSVQNEFRKIDGLNTIHCMYKVYVCVLCMDVLTRNICTCNWFVLCAHSFPFNTLFSQSFDAAAASAGDISESRSFDLYIKLYSLGLHFIRFPFGCSPFAIATQQISLLLLPPHLHLHIIIFFVIIIFVFGRRSLFNFILCVGMFVCVCVWWGSIITDWCSMKSRRKHSTSIHIYLDGKDINDDDGDEEKVFFSLFTSV